MIVKVENKSILDIEADIIVVNLFEGVKFPGGVTGVVDRAYNNIISDYVIGKENFTGKYGEIYQLPLVNENKKILVVGIGSSADFSFSKIRDLTAKVVRQYNGKAKKIVSILHGAGIAGLCAEGCAQMVAEGAISGTYAFDKYKTIKKEDTIEEFIIAEIDFEKYEKAKAGASKGIIVANSVNNARDLIKLIDDKLRELLYEKKA